ncbi:MAG TPA: DUF2911 domain-containing protein [Longimicrobiales bacterium]|nr:DUF2911 domain-containing protein [Longimicrobiales bacterium]
MKTGISTALLIAATASTLSAQQQAQPKEPPIVMPASSFASVEVHINSRPIGKEWYAEDAGLTGPARIAITYGQPHARGRKVEGGLIPADTIWRFGANAATTLHTDVDITVGNVQVDHGDYTLFIRPSSGGWQLVISRETAQWGTDYNRSRDVGRVALTARTLTDAEESLSIYLVPESAQPRSGYADLRGTLRIKWGKTELSAPWTVRR